MRGSGAKVSVKWLEQGVQRPEVSNMDSCEAASKASSKNSEIKSVSSGRGIKGRFRGGGSQNNAIESGLGMTASTTASSTEKVEP